MRSFAKYGCLAFVAGALLTSAGCISDRTSQALANAVVGRIIAPPTELAVSTMAFKNKNGCWPHDYDELRAFNETAHGPPLTNYDRVDFSERADGKLDIHAVGSGMTNQMTLSLKENQKQ